MDRSKEGSFSVECALIMPIILMCIISLIWLMIFMYDRIMINKAVIHAVLGCDYVRNIKNSQIEEMIAERINEELDGRILATKDIKVSIKVNDINCKVEVETQLNVPEGISWLEGISTIKIQKQKSIINGTEIVQDTKRYSDYLEYLKNLENKVSEEGEIDEGGLQTGE